MLQYTSHQLQRMKDHAQQVYPEECCGLLIGKIERSSVMEVRLLVEVWQTQNSWSLQVAEELTELEPNLPHPTAATTEPLPTKNRRYWIDPKEILQAHRQARAQDLEIIGVYHSHPDYPAVPSESDRAMAWTGYSYIILSIVQATVQDWQCWCLDDQSQFQREETTQHLAS